MKKLVHVVLCALFATLPFATVHAQVLGSTSTYSGLTWSFSTTTAGISSCTTLVLDATGDIYHSDNYAVYGQLVCPSLGGNYASSGNAYFDSAGYFHMSASIGPSLELVCDNLSGASLSGSCPIYNKLGTQMGTAFISFL